MEELVNGLLLDVETILEIVMPIMSGYENDEKEKPLKDYEDTLREWFTERLSVYMS